MDQPLSLDRPPSRARPPSTPADWAERDRDLATQLALRPIPPEPHVGATACACSGLWRYCLAESARVTVCRCLHCGALVFEPAPADRDGHVAE